MNQQKILLVVGFLFVIIGVAVLVEFIAQFAKLIIGLLIFVIGVYLVGFARQSAKVRVR
ncbi:MAG: hypothetical protein ACMXYD_01175 [Candidatus Woesearchaeota archaeon]